MTREQCFRAAQLLDLHFLQSVSPSRSQTGLGHAHLRWMVQEIIHGAVIGKDEAWLGYIQGVLVATGGATLGEMKRLNRSVKS